MKRIILVLGIFLMGAVLLACTTKVAPVENAESPKILTPEAQNTAKEPWQVEWEKTISLAKREGALKLPTSLEPSVIKPIIGDFRSKFGIDVEFISGRGPEVIAKLFAERRAGLFNADVYIGGADPILFSLRPAGVLLPLRPALFLPEVLDTKLWYKNALPWVDREQNLVLQTKGRPEPGEVLVNSDLVKKGELTSYYELLQPKYKGKINLTDPTIAGRGQKWFGYNLFFKTLDMEYMKALAEQQPLILRDKRLQVEWVARGKYLVAMLPNSPQVDEFLQVGAPLDYLNLKESKKLLGGGSSAVSLIDKSPNPQSARLFINWFLSKEGQTSFSRAYSYQSFREDVPTDHLPPKEQRDPNVDYRLENEESLEFIQQASAKAREIFGPLLR